MIEYDYTNATYSFGKFAGKPIKAANSTYRKMWHSSAKIRKDFGTPLENNAVAYSLGFPPVHRYLSDVILTGGKRAGEQLKTLPVKYLRGALCVPRLPEIEREEIEMMLGECPVPLDRQIIHTFDKPIEDENEDSPTPIRKSRLQEITDRLPFGHKHMAPHFLELTDAELDERVAFYENERNDKPDMSINHDGPIRFGFNRPRLNKVETL